MTKDELMQMARDSGFWVDERSHQVIERFANSILERAAAECDELSKCMQQDDHMQGCIDSAYQVRALNIKEGE